MGLKTAPFIATQSLQINLNQKNFEAFIDTVKDKDLKVSLKQLKLDMLYRRPFAGDTQKLGCGIKFGSV